MLTKLFGLSKQSKECWRAAAKSSFRKPTPSISNDTQHECRKTDTDRTLEYYLFDPLKLILSAKTTGGSSEASKDLRKTLPQITSSGLLADRQRRLTLECSITYLLLAECRLVQYMDVDMSDETAMVVARRDESHSPTSALFS